MGHKSHYISACWDSNSCFSEGSGYLIDTHFPLSLLLNKHTIVPIQAWRLHVTINLNSCSCRSHFSTSPCKSISHTGSKINNELLSRCISCCVSNFWQECLHGGGGCLHQGSLCQNEVPMPHAISEITVSLPHGPMVHCLDGCHECCSHKQSAVEIHTAIVIMSINWATLMLYWRSMKKMWLWTDA